MSSFSEEQVSMAQAELARLLKHNRFIRLRNSAGFYVLTVKPRLWISIVFFINVRAASHNSTQSIGK